MTRRLTTLAGVALFAAALAAWITWPQPLHLRTAVVSHHDPYFSIWRLAWIAHALTSDPRHLFDANIFYPAKGTLAFSDATLLEGIAGAPLFWVGLTPVLIYNLLLMVGFVGSGVGMFVLARQVTGSMPAALIGAAVFTMVPYRTEHVMHLELQWVMWTPLTFWALHRAVEKSSWRFAMLAGLMAWLQLVSCMYYGIFLGLVLVAFLPVLMVISGRQALAALPKIVGSGLIAGLLALPVVWPYFSASEIVGGRDVAEISRYSARPINYLASSPASVWWGWTAERWGSPELRLFPGLVATVLALAGLLHRSWRWTLLYAVVSLVAIELSLGANGTLYPWLSARLTPLEGLRSPSRFGMIAMAGVAILAAFGAEVVVDRTRLHSWRVSAFATLIALLLFDAQNRALPLTPENLGTKAPVYRVISSAGPGVILELPLPRADRLPGWDPYYAAWSTTHWHPLVNGYSGYHPPDYFQTLARMQTFPDDASLARLRAHDVRYIVIHRAFIEPSDYTRLMLRVALRPELKPYGMYKGPAGNADLFILDH